MSLWKVLVIALLGCVCLGLVFAAIVVPMGMSGGTMWLWVGGLIAAAAVMCTLFSLFLQYAGKSLDAPARPLRR